VDAALSEIVKTDPPRSWRTEERAEWARLPPAVRDAITRRENDRDKELRRLQSELAKLRHDGAAEPVISNIKDTIHETC